MAHSVDRAKIRTIVGEHGRLPVPVDRLDDASDLYAAGLTSLATVGLMLALEDAFEVEFPERLLGRKTFGSIDSIAQALEQILGG